MAEWWRKSGITLSYCSLSPAPPGHQAWSSHPMAPGGEGWIQSSLPGVTLSDHKYRGDSRRPPRDSGVTTQYPLCADQGTSVCWWWARPERSYIAWPDISQIMQHSAEGCSDKPVNCRDPGNKILILSSFLQNKSSLPLHLNETCHSLFVFCKVIPLLLLLKTGTQFGWTIPDWLNPERNTSTRLLYFIL